MIRALHHVQICIDPGKVDEARRFYCGLLGLSEIEKPAELAKRGGFWLQVGDRELHVAEEPGPRSRRAHVAYEVDDLDAARARLEAAGFAVKPGEEVTGWRRCELRDPFDNRVELVARSPALI